MLENRQRHWYGWFVIGNEDYAFASKDNEIHHFTRDPDVNNDAFIRACGWCYPGEELESV